MSLKVLVTGASGFLGWNFCRQLARKYEITGTFFRNRPQDIKAVNWVRINLIETPQLEPLVAAVKPDIILHLAAISKASFCEQHPALSHHINVYTTVALAKVAEVANIPFIFSSTDLVFNGASAPYVEDDFCYPLSQYGIQKQTAEDILLTDFDNTIVARLPLMFGATPSYTSNFFTQSIDKLKKKEEIYAFADEKRTPLSGSQTAQWLSRLIDYTIEKKHQERVLHLAGNEAISRYDFCKQVAACYALDSQLIIPTLQKDLDLNPARPADVSLQNDLAKKILNFDPPSLQKQLLEEQLLLNK